MTTTKDISNRTAEKRARVLELLREGKRAHAIAAIVGVSSSVVTSCKIELGLPLSGRIKFNKSVQDTSAVTIRDMAESGYTTRQISQRLKMAIDLIRDIATREGIAIPADAVVGKPRHINATRVVDRMVIDADNLCADVNLINFEKLDPSKLEAWILAFNKSRLHLSQFITRLRKERDRHAKAAATVAAPSGEHEHDAAEVV